MHRVGHSGDFFMFFWDSPDVIPWVFGSVDPIHFTALRIFSKGGDAVCCIVCSTDEFSHWVSLFAVLTR